MFDFLAGAPDVTKSLFLMVVGVLGTHATLLLFFIMIKVLLKVFTRNADGSTNAEQ